MTLASYRYPVITVINNISICIAPFARGYKALLPIIRVSGNRHSHFASPKGATGQVHTLSALYISHDRYPPDALRSTKQLRLSILPKDTNTLALGSNSRSSDPESCTVPLDHTRSQMVYSRVIFQRSVTIIFSYLSFLIDLTR